MIDKRLEQYRIAKGLKAKEFAHIIGISPGSYSEIKNGKTSPRADTLEKIIRNTEIDARWLLTGEGPMIRETVEPPTGPPGDVVRPFKRRQYDLEIQEVLDKVTEILQSDDETAKAALKMNVLALHKCIHEYDRVAKLERIIEHMESVLNQQRPGTGGKGT